MQQSFRTLEILRRHMYVRTFTRPSDYSPCERRLKQHTDWEELEVKMLNEDDPDTFTCPTAECLFR